MMAHVSELSAQVTEGSGPMTAPRVLVVWCPDWPVTAIGLDAAAGGWGAWRYFRAEPSLWFWRLLRASQAAILASKPSIPRLG